MTKKQKAVLINRLKSFAWREGALISIALLGFVAENIGLWGFSVQVETLAVGTITLVVGEITKFLNS